VVGAVFSNATFFGPDPVILSNYSTNVSSGTWQGVNGGSQRLGAPASDTGALALTLDGDELEAHYRHCLEELGKQPGMLGEIFKKARAEIQNPNGCGA